MFAISGERHDGLDAASGFAGYFLKPVDLDVLVAELCRAATPIALSRPDTSDRRCRKSWHRGGAGVGARARSARNPCHR